MKILISMHIRYIVSGILLNFLISFNTLLAQDDSPWTPARQDSLRGYLSPERSCFDVTFYHLDVRIDPFSKTIRGSNKIYFSLQSDTKILQLDLYENLDIEKIILDNKEDVLYKREHNAFHVKFDTPLLKGSTHMLEVFYNGTPIVAEIPPWDAGFVWSEDANGKPWAGVSCQGAGASVWWPNKDHQSDKPDSMMISVTVPKGFENISNGKLRKVTPLKKGWKKFDWFVSYPIVNYNVSVNIGDFKHIRDFYAPDSLVLDYYVLPGNEVKAVRHFAQVKTMLECFSKYFGPYPFIKDGYKLIQTPYLGMEHQSAISYGNDFLMGYRGTSTSDAGVLFDFIIIHESAHEWWGNSITCSDIADMWIHEAYATYAEALYVEYLFGYPKSLDYLDSKKKHILYDIPVSGQLHVNHKGSADMYNKGALMLNTLRSVINNDSLWFETMPEIQRHFRYQSVNRQQIIDAINEVTGNDYRYIFDQYLDYTQNPLLKINIRVQEDHAMLFYHWEADVEDFNMPVTIKTHNRFEFIYPEESVKLLELDGFDPDNLEFERNKFLYDLDLDIIYVDPEVVE